MVKKALLFLAGGFLLFEFMEHVVLPLIWALKDRKRRSVCGATGMVGKTGEIKHWQEFEGKVSVNGEVWRAVSDFRLTKGDRVVIQTVQGLTLSVIPCKEKTGADS